MPNRRDPTRAAFVRSRLCAKQANMRPAGVSTTTRIVRAVTSFITRIALAKKSSAPATRTPRAHAPKEKSRRTYRTAVEFSFFADPEFKRSNASIAQNCATFADAQTQRAHRQSTRAMEISAGFSRQTRDENRARSRQCSSLSINSAYASGSSSSSVSSARLLGLTTKIQPSPYASSLIVSGFSASALLTEITLPETGA
jgi:hypothetical protein